MEASACAACGIPFFCSLWLKAPFLKINKCKIHSVINISVKYVMLLCVPYLLRIGVMNFSLPTLKLSQNFWHLLLFRSAMHCTVLGFQLFPSNFKMTVEA